MRMFQVLMSYLNAVQRWAFLRWAEDARDARSKRVMEEEIYVRSSVAEQEYLTQLGKEQEVNCNHLYKCFSSLICFVFTLDVIVVRKGLRGFTSASRRTPSEPQSC